MEGVEKGENSTKNEKILKLLWQKLICSVYNDMLFISKSDLYKNIKIKILSHFLSLKIFMVFFSQFKIMWFNYNYQVDETDIYLTNV